jgi:LysR family transcriptional regulator, transcriptional activator for dmlA
MTNGVQPADLGFFCVLAGAGSLGAAARELGVTTPAVSKHLAAMEARVGLSLVNRSTRRMSLTPEGELYLEHARRILGEIDDMAQLLGVSKATPQGCCGSTRRSASAAATSRR